MVSYTKMSKKERRKINAAKRGDWNGVKTVTRVLESKKHYQRKPKYPAF